MAEYRTTSTGRIDTPDLRTVRVSYTVERDVQVWAFSAAEARKLARDPRDWADASEDIHERMDTLRVIRDQPR